MIERQPAVYILASKPNGTLYVGVTSNLNQRVWQHKTSEFDGFTKKYKVHRLVYFEFLNTMHAAINREKILKKWKREWKVALIEENNPEWLDLYDELR
jgi:putative endonuclease